ncbi:SOS response-associated peptidase [Bacillus spongiae]|uniref:Abasic site processing protein n=1 Tax=Bacillus spongiae TaxID=2683610 RepID=A0ABU8HDF9_9BACI
MCGRYTITIPPEEWSQLITIDEWSTEWEISYNVAPGQKVLSAIYYNSKVRAGPLHWGLIPKWSPKGAAPKPMINARGETLSTKVSFKSLVDKRRCVFMADSFFEWKRKGKERIPYRFQLENGEPFAFAGLWDAREEHGQKHSMGTIITTKANDVVQPIHDRMPVILDTKDKILNWLNVNIPFDQVSSLLTPLEDEKMEFYRVSNIVNSSQNNNEECIKQMFT